MINAQDCLSLGSMARPYTGATGTYTLNFQVRTAFGAGLLRLLKASGAKVIRVYRDAQSAVDNAWVLHVRLPHYLEADFGFTREFVVGVPANGGLATARCHAYPDQYPRCGESIDSSFAMLISEDSAAGDKLNDWAIERSHGLLIAPLDAKEVDALSAEDELANVLRDSSSPVGSRHATSMTNVTLSRARGSLGRGPLLRDLDRKLASGECYAGSLDCAGSGKRVFCASCICVCRSARESFPCSLIWKPRPARRTRPSESEKSWLARLRSRRSSPIGRHVPPSIFQPPPVKWGPVISSP